METQQPKYTWENRLSYEDREAIIDFYKKGFAVFKIATAFSSTPSTIEYHLNKAQVLYPLRKPFAVGIIVRPMKKESVRSIVFPSRRRLVTKLDDNVHYYDEYGFEYKQPTKNYKDYLREEQLRKPIIRSNDLCINHGAGDTFKCRIHVDLTEVKKIEPIFMSHGTINPYIDNMLQYDYATS